jgi:hypothetical protein
MVIVAVVGLLIIVFTAVGVYELTAEADADRSVPFETRRRNALFLVLAAIGALGLCATAGSFFSWADGSDAQLSWEAGAAKLNREKRVAKAGIVVAIASSIAGLAVPRRNALRALKVAAILPLPLVVVWAGFVRLVVSGLRIR